MAEGDYKFRVRTADEIRDSMLRSTRNGLIRIGVEDPNVTKNSDEYVHAQSIAEELSVTEANALVSVDDIMPDTATGEKLLRWLRLYNIDFREASGSAGVIEFSSSASSTVETGRELVDPSGLRYAVSVGGIYSDGEEIPIAAVSTGSETNLEAGTVLRWLSPPGFASATANVGGAGLKNGAPKDTEEIARARLLANMASPPLNDNAAAVAKYCEDSTSSVEKAFVYPSAQGPSTVHACVVSAPTDTNKSRELDTTKLNTIVIPYVTGRLVEHTHILITTAYDVDADVAFDVTIPDSPMASTPGPGGGWVDGTPWPQPNSTGACTVLSVTNDKSFTIDNVLLDPAETVTRISWLSPYDWKLYTATVLSFTNMGPSYSITIDVPFVDIAVGCYIWPSCENQDAYVQAALDAFASMGPGEKTSLAPLSQRAFRRPTSTQGHPSAVGPWMLSKLTDVGSEVESALFRYRDCGGTTSTSAVSSISAPIPGGITGEPRIYVPRHIGFYPAQ